MPDNKVVTRFPPSPTGFLQMGNIRTALYNYLFSRHNDGKFLVRIEDTDKERSKKEYEDAIFNDLEWLGLEHQGEVLRSSDRTEIYKKKLHELIEKGYAYISQESEGENREVVRFKNPGGEVKFQDLIRGEVSMDVSDLKDFIIARNINDPIYHLAVCVDDLASGVTHIIRGEDHISNTPRQILIIEALGGTRPVYAHIPLVLALDKSKLSKRKHGETASLKYYINKGYLPEAVINFLALIGWNPGGEQEIFTLDELIQKFDFSKVQKGGGMLNIEKLNWINKEHMKKLTDAEFIEKAMASIDFVSPISKPELLNLILRFRDRITKFSDLNEFIRGSSINSSIVGLTECPVNGSNSTSVSSNKKEKNTILVSGPSDYLLSSKDPKISKPELLIPKDLESDAVIKYLTTVKDLIEKNDWEKIIEKNDDSELWIYASKEGRGKVLWPLRVALSGEMKSPDPFEIMKAIGKDATLRRIDNAVCCILSTDV